MVLEYQVGTTNLRGSLKALERENRELSRKAAAFFRPGGARSPRDVMVSFIDAHRKTYEVEPICAELPIAPSTYYESKAREAGRTLLPARTRRDAKTGKELLKWVPP